MCQYCSFLHLPATGEVKVKILDSHGETEKLLKLDPKVWIEGHYLPDGSIDLRLMEDDRVDKVEYETAFKNRFPTFKSFMIWANKQDVTIGSELDLSGLTSKEKEELRKKYPKLIIY